MTSTTKLRSLNHDDDDNAEIRSGAHANHDDNLINESDAHELVPRSPIRVERGHNCEFPVPKRVKREEQLLQREKFVHDELLDTAVLSVVPLVTFPPLYDARV
eukprot:CFRG5548T1